MFRYKKHYYSSHIYIYSHRRYKVPFVRGADRQQRALRRVCGCIRLTEIASSHCAALRGAAGRTRLHRASLINIISSFPSRQRHAVAAYCLSGIIIPLVSRIGRYFSAACFCALTTTAVDNGRSTSRWAVRRVDGQMNVRPSHLGPRHFCCCCCYYC